MKLVHVVPQVDREASGLSHSVPSLCNSLVEVGNQVDLLCTAARQGLGPVNIKMFPHWPVLKGFSISPGLVAELARSRSDSDIVHNHSLWTLVNIAPGMVVPGSRAKLVCSPRGTLSPWALSISRCKKRALWPIQRLTLSRASMLHATSHDEMQQIRSTGFRVPVTLVPNGVDIPSLNDSVRKGPRRTLLFLSRIHVTKGIDRLLHSWRDLQHRHPEWDLVIAGKDTTSYMSVCDQLVSELGLERVFFPGPIYGEDKAIAYRNADLFVLPTHSENFGLVVAEALAHGCPVVVSKGAPWSGLEQTDSGWWTDNSVPALTATLDEAMSCGSDVLAQKGVNGRNWMKRDFSWSYAAEKMQVAYEWLLSGGPVPQHVYID